MFNLSLVGARHRCIRDIESKRMLIRFILSPQALNNRDGVKHGVWGIFPPFARNRRICPKRYEIWLITRDYYG